MAHHINLAEAFPPYLRFLFNFHLSWLIVTECLILSLILFILFWLYLKYLEIQKSRKIPYSFLEIKSTDRTLKSPLSTNQLFTALHSIIKENSSGWFITPKKSISLEIVSTKEQKVISRIMKQYFEVADKVEKQIEAAELRVSKLAQAILAKTFQGEIL